MIRVTVWNEFRHEQTSEEVRAVYPAGIHGAIADFLGKEADITVHCATLDEPDCGLTDEVLSDTDVLIWWGHMAHHNVPDEIVNRVQKYVLGGMGLI
ncbi:MAG: ThuA domain-containing protein, partial [Clostridia bacterium]|nr:ThuA domain-containing protein [Clostridia bacterium]